MIKFSPRKLSALLEMITTKGDVVASERGMTVEVEDVVLGLDNPRDRIAIEPWRKMNLGFAITDALSFIVGDNLLAPLAQFVPSFSRFSTNGRTIDGSYGSRIHMCNQLENVIDLLKKNAMTRRAVISIYSGPADLLGAGGLNTPCTLNLHFLVRDGKLNLKAMMRSNDAYLGLPNDVVTFTMLQEFVSIKTDIPLGSYTHFASSLHVYEYNIYGLPDMSYPQPVFPHIMRAMPYDFDPNIVYERICNLKRMSIDDCLDFGWAKSHYEIDLFMCAAAIVKRHEKDAYKLLGCVDDEAIHQATSMWIPKE